MDAYWILITVVATHLYTFAKVPPTVCFKWEHFILCKLYTNNFHFKNKLTFNSSLIDLLRFQNSGLEMSRKKHTLLKCAENWGTAVHISVQRAGAPLIIPWAGSLSLVDPGNNVLLWAAEWWTAGQIGSTCGFISSIVGLKLGNYTSKCRPLASPAEQDGVWPWMVVLHPHLEWASVHISLTPRTLHLPWILWLLVGVMTLSLCIQHMYFWVSFIGTWVHATSPLILTFLQSRHSYFLFTEEET